MRLASRLRRLEACSAAAGLRRCAACGGPADWHAWRPPPGTVPIIVLRDGEEPSGPDRCPACGRPLVIRLEHDRGG